MTGLPAGLDTTRSGQARAPGIKDGLMGHSSRWQMEELGAPGVMGAHTVCKHEVGTMESWAP